MKKFITVLVSSIMLGNVLMGCGSSTTTKDNNSVKPVETSTSAIASEKPPETSNTEPKKGGTITLAQSSEPANMNPLIWATTSDTNVTSLIFDSLVEPADNLEIKPSLAKSWDISEDGLTYTFHLNEGVKWHDGQPFTAEDVSFTFSSMASPKYDMGAYSRVQPVVGAEDFHNGNAEGVSGIKVIDEKTISFTLSEQNAAFLSNLSISVLPKHILGEVSPDQWAKNDFNRNPIGTGEYMFTKWESGQYIQVDKNKEYFRGEPNLDTIITRFGDTDTMLASFMNKEIDMMDIPSSDIETAKGLPFAAINASKDLSVYYIGLNLKNPLFQDEKIRQGLSYALDKELMVSTILGEYGETSYDVFPNNHWSHNPDVTEYNYDVNKAKELFESAGYAMNKDNVYEKDGKALKFTMYVPTGKKDRADTAVMIKQQLAEAGVNMELSDLDFSTLVTKLLPQDSAQKQRAVTAEDFDSFILGFGVEIDPDEYRSYFSTNFMPPNGYNFCGYSDPEVDKLLAKQLTQTNFEERKDTFYQIGKIISDQQPWIPLYCPQTIYISNSDIQNFNPDFRGVTFDARNWYLK